MLIRGIPAVIAAILLSCLSVNPANKASDNRSGLPAGCHPILVLTGTGEPQIYYDCTACINCTNTGDEYACDVSAVCSDDYTSCDQGFKCPILRLTCQQQNGSCDCECTDSGVEVSYTDQYGRLHDIIKNCPDHLE